MYLKGDQYDYSKPLLLLGLDSWMLRHLLSKNNHFFSLQLLRSQHNHNLDCFPEKIDRFGNPADNTAGNVAVD
jgi:hypothetical protein